MADIIQGSVTNVVDGDIWYECKKIGTKHLSEIIIFYFSKLLYDIRQDLKQ